LLAVAIGCGEKKPGTIVQAPPDAVQSVVFSPDAKALAGGMHQRVRIWDTGTWEERGSVKLPSQILCLAYRPDGKGLATGTADGIIRLWDPSSGTEQASFTGHKAGITGLAFSPDGKTLASAAGNPNPYGIVAEVKLWRPGTQEPPVDLSGHKNAVTCL